MILYGGMIWSKSHAKARCNVIQKTTKNEAYIHRICQMWSMANPPYAQKDGITRATMLVGVFVAVLF